MNNHPICNFDREDIRECGGKREVRKILSSLKEKSLMMKGYERSYSDITRGIERIESCLR